MKMTGSYRQGIERFIPSPVEAVLLLTMLVFTAKMMNGQSNTVFLGMNSLVIITVAWVIGVAIRAALNDMRWWLAVSAVFLLLMPWLALNAFQISLMAQVGVFTVMILGLNIVTGLTGQISLGHGALVGISAYTVAILEHQHDWAFIPAAAVAILLTTVVGFALGVPALRLAGGYLAIATIAAAIIFPGVLKLDQVNDTTGGVQGIREPKVQAPGAIKTFLVDNAPSDSYKNEFQQRNFATESWVYYLCTAAAIVGMYAAWNIGRSRFGRAFVAVRDGEVAATSMGINVALYKVTAFGISALYAGVAGVLFFLAISFVAPESFDLVNLSINPLAFLVIGGLATTGGSVLGGFGYMWVPQIIKKVATMSGDFDRLQGAMTGLLLIVVMTRLPVGVWGAMVRINRMSWASLAEQLGAWAKSRTPVFWAGVAAGVVAVLLIGQLIGAVWAMFAVGLLIVSPHDVWYGMYEFVRRPLGGRLGGAEPATQGDLS